MLNSPMAMPPSPAAKVKPDNQPNDFMSWLQESLLGGQKSDQMDPAMANMLAGLLGSQSMQGNYQ